VNQVFNFGKHVVNTTYIKWSAAPALTQATADAIAELIENAYETSGLSALLHTSWSLDTIIVTDLASAAAPQFTGAHDALVGGDGGQLINPSQCGMIEFGTALRGRSFRGRWFQSGFTEASNDGGIIQPGAITALGGFGNALVVQLHSSGPPSQDMAVVSRFSGMQTNLTGRGRLRRVPIPRTAGLATPITTVAAETVWKSQRRRAMPG